MNELRQKLSILQEIEKNAVRAALVEERSRYCLFISAIKPFMVYSRMSVFQLNLLSV
jgi:hypothetical protein